MSLQQRIEQTGVGVSELTKVLTGNPFHIGFGVVVSGTVTYTVEHSFDGINFFPHEELVAQIDNQDGNYAFPIAGIRVNVTAGTGTATLTSLQARG